MCPDGLLPPDWPSGRALRIGLLNNMPRNAMAAAERQHAALIQAASGKPAELRCFALPQDGLPPYYQPFDRLFEAALDGLIVTGAMPLGTHMHDEPAWEKLAQVVDWAAHGTASTLWMCLAAHAAVFRLDGVVRRRLPVKLSGVFSCAATEPHPLLAGMPGEWKVPHSRHNGLDAGDLVQAGYRIHSQGDRVGVDVFGKRVGGSEFVFLQGHPEYEPDTLWREYRRDVRDFVLGRRPDHPELPHDYFDAATAETLMQIRAAIVSTRSVHLLLSVDAAGPVTAGPAAQRWQRPALQLYRNWLALLAHGAAARAQTTPC